MKQAIFASATLASKTKLHINILQASADFAKIGRLDLQYKNSTNYRDSAEMTEFIRVLTPQWMEFTEKRIVTSASRWLTALQEFSCPLFV